MAETEDETEPVHLPEVLVEKIVAEIPLPHIVNARLLSKKWKSKFSRVVRQASTRWPEYYPALVCRGRVEAYNAALNCAARMGCKNIKAIGPNVLVAGSGTLLVSLDFILVPPRAIVINLFSGLKRKIPCPMRIPGDRSHAYYTSPWPILTPMGTDHYELVIPYILTESSMRDDASGRLVEFHITRVNVYNSRSKTWMEKTFKGYHSRISRLCAYMDGSIYCLPEWSHWWYYGVPEDERRKMITGFNTQDGTRTETAQIELHDKMHGKWFDNAVVRCGSRIIVAMFEQNVRHSCSHVKIFQLDIDSFALMELSTFPLDTELLADRYLDNSLISVRASCCTVYILQRDKHILTTYDVNSRTWTSTRSVPEKFFYTHRGTEGRCFVFEPGLNPFVEP